MGRGYRESSQQRHHGGRINRLERSNHIPTLLRGRMWVFLASSDEASSQLLRVPSASRRAIQPALSLLYRRD